MMKLNSLKILGFLLITLPMCSQAQNSPETAQYVLHQPFANTSAIAYKSSRSGAFLFKQQWVGNEGAPSTMLLNFNMPLRSASRFGGILVSNDRIGIHNNTRASLIYAQKFDLTEGSFLTFSAAPGFEMLQSDYSKIQTDFPDDPIYAGGAISLVSFNLASGVSYYNKKFFVGLALPRMLNNHFESVNLGTNKGKIGFDFKQVPFLLSAGWKKDVGKFFTLKPSFLMRYQIGSAMQLDVNAMLEYRESIGIGLSYRTMNTLNVLANYRINKDFKIGYAYNMQMGSVLSQNLKPTAETQNGTSSSIGNTLPGTHEIVLIYGMENGRQANINLPKKIRKHRKKKVKEVRKALKKLDKDKEKLSPGREREKKQPYS